MMKALEGSLSTKEIPSVVSEAIGEVLIWDLHTHLYPPSFGTPYGRNVEADSAGLMLWGIDELLTYHYLVAEFFRSTAADEAAIKKFWSLSKSEQADVIWTELFVKHSPLSEACRGVLTTLSLLGLDPNEKDLAGYQAWFEQQTPEEQIDRVLSLAGVSQVTMTNNVFDDNERQRWLASSHSELCRDPRFLPVLRFDELVCDWMSAATRLNDWGYSVSDDFCAQSSGEVKRFLEDWIARMNPVYCAMSLSPSWRYPADSAGSSSERAGEKCLREAILPVCQDHGLPLALMIGVRRGVNPFLQDAGDSVGLMDVESLESLCSDHPQQRILCTTLARENQHALAVAARKFPNLTPFGCWWFLNNPSLIEEITRMRVELLGPSFIPQHSDARVLEQLIYKWNHSRTILAKVLSDKYIDLLASGLHITREMIQRDAHKLLYGNVAQLLNVS